jgi:hypothetical protein
MIAALNVTPGPLELGLRMLPIAVDKSGVGRQQFAVAAPVEE